MAKRLAQFSIVIFCLAALLSCGSKQSDAIRFGLASMPSNLDPRFYTSAIETRIGRLIYDRLVDFDESMMAKPALASWQQITPKLYRFTIQDQNKTFHDGKRLTSADVKATYDFILEEKHASPHRTSVKLIEKITTPDERTIDFHLQYEDPLFPAYLVIGIVPKHLSESDHSFKIHPIGSGSFEFVDWSSEEKLRIQRIEDRTPFEFLHVQNPTVRVLKLMRGEIDMVQNDLPPELIHYLRDQSDINVIQREGSNFSYLGFNMEDPALKNLDVRRAVAYAIDKDEIIKYVFGNAVKPANALLPPEHWAGNPNLKHIHYNPEKAKTLLAQAGFENKLKLTYKTSNDPFRVRLATVIQDQLARVGIEMEIRSYDWGTFYGDIKNGRFQVFSLAWIGIKTPDIFQYVFHSEAVPPNGANRGRYKDKEMDRLVDEAKRQSDLKIQAAIYQKIQEKVLFELPYIPLWYESHVFISNKRIKNYVLAADGNFDALNKMTRI